MNIINTERDIVLFYYYSTSPFPTDCYLEISNDIVHRNLFLFKCDDGKIHFEFPMFENHTYNSICNRRGVRSLIKRDNDKKYIIFRTIDKKKRQRHIIGYYKVGKQYYQETNLFNNNGFVCGFEASETHLLKKGDLIFKDRSIGRGYNVSWHTEKMNKKLNSFLDKIQDKSVNVSDLYQNETSLLISLFKDKERIEEWRTSCKTCESKKKCYFFKYNERYTKKNPNSNMFDIINKVYNSNIYSKNVLDKIKKIYIR
ncbi:hypothetical protein LCGC14_1872390 [marine sediment metagenome]|uniref:Uncharacterized protein n=1 Tax=marine sediment metagenome TaxID=412755 RepID=A0A0F9G4Q2_9ZZZZ